MTVEIFFDLARVDVLAAPDHHVLDAPDHVAVAVFVHGAQVARMHPARRINGFSRPFLVIPIAQHDVIATGQDLAGFARCDDAAVCVDDLAFYMWQ